MIPQLWAYAPQAAFGLALLSAANLVRAGLRSYRQRARYGLDEPEMKR